MSPVKDNADEVAEPAEKYSTFTTAEKWCIVAMVSYAAWFSTLSSFIYFPAVHKLSQIFSVSVNKINLTITSYTAVATVAPTLVGDTADVLGRRPVYITVLIVYIGANVAIILSDTYPALLALRALQALAISGTFSVAYGVITDVASPGERGSFVSLVSFAITIAPSTGPIIGGSLTYAVGWTWIFWFLCIAAGACLSIMIFLLPETSRNIVGNGSIQPPKYLHLPITAFMCHWKDSDVTTTGRTSRMPNPLKSLKIFARRDNTILIIGCGFLYTIYMCVNTSLSVLFIEIYKLNQLQAGLIYLPFGIGGTVSTFFSGPLLNSAYRNARTNQSLSTNVLTGDELDDFSVEKARLSIVWIPMLVTTCSVVAFGWTLHYHKHIAIPLCLQFLLGLCMQLDFSIYNTLLVDKNHRAPAAAQASSNLVRCSFAAIAIAFLQDLVDAIGIGWTFTSLGGLCLATIGLFVIAYHKGTSWRQKSLAHSTYGQRN